MRVYGDDARLGADELVEVLDVAGDYLVLSVFAQQQRLDDAQAVGHVLGSTVGPRLVLERGLVDEGLAVLVRDGGGEHLLPDAVPPLARLCV